MLEGINPTAFVMGLSAIAAGICSWSGILCGLSQGLAACKVAESVSRQPEARGAILSSTLVTCAVAETTSIYGFVLALIILLGNPFGLEASSLLM
jgi:F-type H+-transporting ATPase subunit c